MMRWSDIPFRPSERKLRRFGGLLALFLGGLSIWRGVARGYTQASAVLGALCSLGAVVSLVRPKWLRPVFVGWMIATFPIGWVVSRLMLILVFHGVFTPVALWFRLIGRDALERAFRPERASYWTPKVRPTSTSSYFRQY